MNKIKVIYHRADFDGLFCREIARQYFGETADYIGWDYGDPVPVCAPEDEVYMLDISVEGLMEHPNLTWIDHHASAIGKYCTFIPGDRIDGVAACRLAWQWFSNPASYFSKDSCLTSEVRDMPKKEDYVARNVTEPLAVRLAGEYDIWDKRDPDAELFQHGLRSRELTADLWAKLLDNSIEETLQVQHSQIIVQNLLEAGRAIQYAKTQENESIIQENGFTIEFEGLQFLACNAARYNSHLFKAGLGPEHEGCLGFNWSGKDWRISLYGVPGKPQIDLSKIAVKYGGGGHRQACGFRTDKLPFL